MTTTVEALGLSGEQLSDTEVVRRIVAGDAALFEILMRRHNQRVYRAVRAVLRSDDDAEDVMQQAYINAYKHLGQFAGDAQFSTWLTRIAINEALRRRKRARTIGEGDDSVTISLVEDDAPDPEMQASTAELRELLEREIAALPESYRLVIMLRDIEGLSTAEAAQSLGLSEDVVKTRLHRGRTMLRDSLYRRAGVTFESLFTFGNARCDRVVAFVMARVGLVMPE
jgi:RNA polymerase sigma-70 factor (ECF subfamily)